MITLITSINETCGFEGVDVCGVDDVYIDYTIIGKSRGFKEDDVYDVNDVNDVYTDNINQ